MFIPGTLVLYQLILEMDQELIGLTKTNWLKPGRRPYFIGLSRKIINGRNSNLTSNQETKFLNEQEP